MSNTSVINFNKNLIRCWQSLQGGRSIAVYTALVDITGSIKPAVFLSQLIYWTRNSTDMLERDGWILKSIEEMENETGLTRKEQGTCKKNLEELGLITRARFGMGARLALRVNINVLANLLSPDYQNISLSDFQLQTPFFRKFFGKRITYHRDLVTLTGDINAAIMLSYALKHCVTIQSTQQIEQRVFITKTIQDWQKEIKFSKYVQKTARNRLLSFGFIVEKHYFASRRIFTLIDGHKIITQLKAKQCGVFMPNNCDKTALSIEPKEHPLDFKCANEEQKNIGSEKPEMPNPAIKKEPKQKLRNIKTRNTEMSNPAFLMYSNYKVITNYNYTKQKEVVVNYDDLIWPKLFNATTKSSSIILIKKFVPDFSIEQVQEILDEIAGQQKPVKNATGFLYTLLKLAASGELICTVAAKHKAQRAKQLKINAALNKNIEEQPKSLDLNKDSNVKDLAIESMKKRLNLKSKF